MQIFEIGVRFMRRVQVKEYEPREIEVSLKAQLAEGEDHNQALATLLSDSKSQVSIAHNTSAAGSVKQEVLISVDKPSNIEKDTAVAAAVTLAKQVDKKAGTKTATTGKNTAASKAKAAETSAKQSAKSAPRAALNDDEFAPSATANDEDFGGSSEAKVEETKEEWETPAPAMTAQELTSYISKQISDKVVVVADVKALLARFGVAMSTHLSDEQRSKFKAELDALIAKNK